MLLCPSWWKQIHGVTSWKWLGRKQAGTICFSGYCQRQSGSDAVHQKRADRGNVATLQLGVTPVAHDIDASWQDEQSGRMKSSLKPCARNGRCLKFSWPCRVRITLVIVTSPATDRQTRKFFADMENFGLLPSQVKFQIQVAGSECAKTTGR